MPLLAEQPNQWRTLKPCFHMYSVCPFTYYTDPDPECKHINDPHYYLLKCFHISTCLDLYVMSVLIASWSDSTIYMPAVWSWWCKVIVKRPPCLAVCNSRHASQEDSTLICTNTYMTLSSWNQVLMRSRIQSLNQCNNFSPRDPYSTWKCHIYRLTMYIWK